MKVVLLTTFIERLQLKDKNFKVIQSASRVLLANVWSFLNPIDPDFNLSYTYKISVKVAKVWSRLNLIDPDFNLSYTDKISVKVLTPNF